MPSEITFTFFLWLWLSHSKLLNLQNFPKDFWRISIYKLFFLDDFWSINLNIGSTCRGVLASLSIRYCCFSLLFFILHHSDFYDQYSVDIVPSFTFYPFSVRQVTGFQGESLSEYYAAQSHFQLKKVGELLFQVNSIWFFFLLIWYFL